MIDMLEATRALMRKAGDDALIVPTLGNAGLNLFNVGDRPGNLYLRNAMGLACSVGLGVAMACPRQRVIILDGDGSLLMNLGSVASEAWRNAPNLIHICWDNRVYQMTGGQPTAASGPAELAAIAEGAGFTKTARVETLTAFEEALEEAVRGEGPWFIHALVKEERAERSPDSPKSTPRIRDRFMAGVKP